MVGAQVVKDPVKTDKPPSAAEQFKALQDAFTRVGEDLDKAYEEADSAAERKKLVADFRKKQRDFVRRSLGLARKFSKDPVAVDALVFVVTYGRGAAEVDKAVDILVKDHAAGKAVDICPAMAQSVNGEKVLRAVLEKNPRRDAQGVTTLYLGMHLKGVARMIHVLGRPAELVDKDMADSLEPETIKRLKARDADKLRAEAEKLFLRARAQYGDIKLEDSKLKTLAEEELYELHHLSLGSRALDIQGEDIDGKKLKLSDFRGKVVVLDFWATW
jgi:hypothetical protein